MNQTSEPENLTLDSDLNPELECENDTDCSNGIFCDGEEKCFDGTCIDGLPPCLDDETCVEKDEICVSADFSMDCETDSDCDDGIYCNGEESCFDGVCYEGEAPCVEGYECNEETSECKYDNMVTLTYPILIKKAKKPIFRDKSCQWIIIKCAEDIDLNDPQTIITIESSDDNYHGVEIDETRNPVQKGNLIFIPVCIWRDATSGEWTVVIETEIANSYSTVQGLIKASFRVH